MERALRQKHRHTASQLRDSQERQDPSTIRFRCPRLREETGKDWGHYIENNSKNNTRQCDSQTSETIHLRHWTCDDNTSFVVIKNVSERNPLFLQASSANVNSYSWITVARPVCCDVSLPSPRCRLMTVCKSTWRRCVACSCVEPGSSGTSCTPTRSSHRSSRRSSNARSAITHPTPKSASSHRLPSSRIHTRCLTCRPGSPSPIAATFSASRSNYQKWRRRDLSP